MTSTPTGLSQARRACEPAIRKLLHVYWRFRRGMTLGVRGVVVDGQSRVFLVKHSYVDGWQLPGGGVEVGETMLYSLTRELMEEGNIEVTGRPDLFSVYFNKRASRRDHVALYVVRHFHQAAPHTPNHEIIDSGFYPLSALPAGTTPATHARLDEVFRGKQPTEWW